MEENKAEKKKRIHRKSGLEITSNGDGTCYVSGIGTCRYADVFIPDECNGERVTGIGEQAFYKRENIVSVVIPESVTSIGELAFYHCENLESIQFKGSSEQWKTVSKGMHWNLDVPAAIGFNYTEPPVIRGSKNRPVFYGGVAGADNKKSKLKILLALVPVVLLLIGGIFFLSIPKTSHNHEYTAKITEPTCTAQGFTTYTCACGECFIDEIKNAFDHKPGDAATCTTSQNCMVCNTELKAALGHTPGEWEIVTEATKTEDGLKVQNCSVCGVKFAEEVIPATGSIGLKFTSKGDG
ncbi:MAG: leucine-rich repeat protein, partial [Clostridia bacterium]|nr:leucine-rich repeat protein [Clostridia bacterium]